ncbi:MAG TPA: Maf-like protein [Paludibacteraceae bacterium]|jgi:septum formation protein|nr:Maf-like protein [Paludibacteraceae bacterium]HPH62677.1 Maf-like protein [Paludibacteraceae bacterium]
MLENYHIILASNSPRRHELLKGLELSFEVKTIKGLDESYPDTLKGEEIPLFLAKKKGSAYTALLQDNTMIITADTIVWHENKVLGKPKDRQMAIDMIHSMSGKTHKVFTGVCIKTKEKEVTFVAFSDVTFANLTDEEIEFYVDKYKPFDKAGAYGVQEWIGYIGVEHINGSFYNIMGLPVQRLYTELKKF